MTDLTEERMDYWERTILPGRFNNPDYQEESYTLVRMARRCKTAEAERDALKLRVRKQTELIEKQEADLELMKAKRDGLKEDLAATEEALENKQPLSAYEIICAERDRLKAENAALLALADETDATAKALKSQNAALTAAQEETKKAP